jgi:hypothetical protein
MKRLFVIICALALAATVANADVPDPSNCSSTLDQTGRLLIIPDDNLGPVGAADFTLTIRNAANNPIAGAVVEVDVGCQIDGFVDLCADATTTGTTGATGEVDFNIAGGGCCKASAVVVIRANGVEVRSYDAIMSPDYEFSDNGGGLSGGDLLVNPVDLSAFVAAYQGGVGPASCHDYDNSGVTDPVDLSVFVASYQGGANFCL